MVLNYIWVAFLVIAFLIAFLQLILGTNIAAFEQIITAMFEAAKTGFEIALGLTGMLSLWLGIMKIGEQGGLIKKIAKWLSPFLEKLFPEIPRNHPVLGSIFMNISANLLGLDNAATPLGLKAMKELQSLNPQKEKASNAMIMFLVLNTSGLTLIPISILVYRANLGSATPTDVFIPILLTTFCSTLAGIIVTAIYQRINLLQPIILFFLGGFSLLIAVVFWGFLQLPKTQMMLIANIVSNFILFAIIILFILQAIRKINVYEAFIEGAKEGFQTAIQIIPYLIAILIAIATFRASGGMEFLIDIITYCFKILGLPIDWIGALPTALMKPLSGSGARGLMVDAMQTYGADSFIGKLACIFQGSTDTTFYIIAVYFGSVGIKCTRYALTCGLIADFTGLLVAIIMAYSFFS